MGDSDKRTISGQDRDNQGVAEKLSNYKAQVDQK